MRQYQRFGNTRRPTEEEYLPQHSAALFTSSRIYGASFAVFVQQTYEYAACFLDLLIISFIHATIFLICCYAIIYVNG